MEYFRQLQALLDKEREEDRVAFEALTRHMRISEKRENGMTWFPIALRGSEPGRGDYLTIEIERTSHQELQHQFRFGMSVAFFSNHDAENDRLEGIISYISGNRMKVALRVDELPDWSRDGKLGIDAIFDEIIDFAELRDFVDTKIKFFSSGMAYTLGNQPLENISR